MHYHDYQHIVFERTDRIVTATLNRPEQLNATNERLHFELSQLWDTVEADDDVDVAVVTGAGGSFCAGGDLEMVERMVADPALVRRQLREAEKIAYGIVNCSKPVVSAVEGVAVGAGMAVAVLADISVVAEDARLNDGHVRLGVAAGDHAALIWPLLCGMANAKRYLLTGDFIDGAEAARIGLVTAAVPAHEVLGRALELAARVAGRDPLAVSWTKRALNHWLRSAGPAFEHSLALEMLGFAAPGARAGLDAVRRAQGQAPATRPPEQL